MLTKLLLSRHTARLLSTTAATPSGSSLVPAVVGITTTTPDLIPEEVVHELNKYIIGQEDAKKAVAIALRNRWRRRQLKSDVLRAEISPMNILMSGPTGSGKTEIARRLAKISSSPFLKVEATKFTEVGIYGTNTDSMVKDLVDVAVGLERERMQKLNAAAARERAIDRLVDAIADEKSSGTERMSTAARVTLREQIVSGKADHMRVVITLSKAPKKPMRAGGGASDMMMDMPPELQNMMGHLDELMKSKLGFPGAGAAGKGHNNKADAAQEMTVKDALPKLQAEEADAILDEDQVIQQAIDNVQQNGIIFLDEIDKLAAGTGGGAGRGGDHDFRKGEGVQKELLALTEGCAVQTRYGLVHTDHILFIASGAFHRCKPSDLMPELQGRLPIRVSLSPLGAKEFERILTETEFNLLHQMQQLMETEGVKLTFSQDAIHEIAQIAQKVNSQTDDIGARRLATIVSKILEEVSFHAPKMGGVTFEVDKKYVNQQLANVLEKTDLTKFIL